MSPIAIAAVAAVAALLAAFAPTVLRRLPEPAEPGDDKIPYARLAGGGALRAGLALAAASAAGSVIALADPRRAGAIGLWVFLAALGALLSYVDWRTRLLPFLLVAPAYPIVVLLVMAAAWVDGAWGDLPRVVACWAGVFAFYWLSWRLIGRSVGYGDVRLSGIIGAALGYLGVEATLVGTWAGFAIGAFGGLLLAAVRRTGLKASFPFGPAMFLGLWVGLLLYV